MESHRVKVNVGSGVTPLHGWLNMDNSLNTFHDIRASGLNLPFRDESVDEVYAGHFVEHLTQDEATLFVAECKRVLKPGGKLGVVVPDTREVMRRYLDPESDARMQFPRMVWNDLHDLDAVCKLFLYSTVQDSPHKWSYDRRTLARLLDSGGFNIVGEINNWMDPRVSVGAWYQFGLDAVKPQEAN